MPRKMHWHLALNIIREMERQAELVPQIPAGHILLFQTPAESTAYRFARLDLKHFSPLSGRFIKGNIARGEVYYTNSTHLTNHAAIPPFERVNLEGRFHPFLKADAVTHLWLGDMNFLQKIW